MPNKRITPPGRRIRRSLGCQFIMNRPIKSISIILTPIILIYSCTFTYKKSNRDTIDTYCERINSYSERFSTYIILSSEEEFEVVNLDMRVDSTSFTPIESYKRTKISTSEINYIEFKDSARGAVGGLLMGLLGGLVVGFTALALSPEGGGHPDMSGFVVIYGALIGGTVGTVIGAIKQDRNIFYLNGTPDE